MSHDPISPPVETAEPTPNSGRQAGRVQPYWLDCSLGLLLDVSATGAKVIAKRKLSGRVKLRIWDKTAGVRLKARVLRSQRLRFRQHEVAVRFVDVDDEAAAQLAAIASHFHD